MDSLLVNIENVVIMRWSFLPNAMVIWNPANMIWFLNVLGNQSSHFHHFDQPVLAYKRWFRVIMYDPYNISGLKLMEKYSTVYSTLKM